MQYTCTIYLLCDNMKPNGGNPKEGLMCAQPYNGTCMGYEDSELVGNISGSESTQQSRAHSRQPCCTVCSGAILSFIAFHKGQSGNLLPLDPKETAACCQGQAEIADSSVLAGCVDNATPRVL